MFNSKISNLQLYTAPANITGLMESNKLYNAFLVEPEKMQAVMARAFGQANGQEDVLDMLTTGAMQTEYVEVPVYRWPLYTKDSRSIEVAGPAISGGATPGIGGSVFYVPFSERHFELGANLRADDGTMVRVQEDPYQDGDTYVYGFILNDGNPASFMDPSQVTYGSRFMETWADYEEFSNGGTGVSMTTPAMLENTLGTFRTKVAVTREAAKTKLVMDIITKGKDGKPKVSKVWASELEWMAYARHREKIVYASIYANKSSHRKGANGRIVYQGAGFREQISPSNIWEYSGNEVSYALFEDFVENLERTAINNGGTPNLVCLTGRDGLKMIDNMLRKRFKDQGLVISDSSKFLKGDGNNLKLTGYFSEFTTQSGITVSFKNYAPYNDADFHRTKNPMTGNPLESSVFTFMNFGTDGKGGANIKKIVFRGGEKLMWTVSGSTSANNQEKKSLSSEGSSGVDGYEFYMLDQCGIKVSDPTSCGELRPVGLKYY
jgi:hypothetical protein